MRESDIINNVKIPTHIAIIMDGNGRWAKRKGLPRAAGHKAGVEAIREILRASSDMGIGYLTVYAFSTENWTRPKEEVSTLFSLLLIYLEKEIKEIHSNNVKLNIIGDYQKLPPKITKKINKALEHTKNNTGLVFNIALNYGSRDEMVAMVKKMYDLIKNGDIEQNDINYAFIENLFYTKGIPDPDLVIRTSGEIRLSNFLLPQLAYSELWFTDVYWPDFKKEHLMEAISSYQKRKRRYGGIEAEENNED